MAQLMLAMSEIAKTPVIAPTRAQIIPAQLCLVQPVGEGYLVRYCRLQSQPIKHSINPMQFPNQLKTSKRVSDISHNPVIIHVVKFFFVIVAKKVVNQHVVIVAIISEKQIVFRLVI